MNSPWHILSLALSKKPDDRLAFRLMVKRWRQRFPVFNRAMELKSRFSQRSASQYIAMQRREYDLLSSVDRVTSGNIDGDAVAGSWRQHDEWPDYEDYLMKYVPKDGTWLALEYGCGPGRNLRRWSARFRRIDGVDISPTNLENARRFLQGQIDEAKMPHLFLTEGMNCGDAPQDAYDFVFSTICLQHICVHEVRTAIFRALFGCLKPGGRLSAQMGFGVPSPSTQPYRANFYAAAGTNRVCDVAIASPSEPEEDLRAIGFRDFESWIRPTGPGDFHPKWIFFTAVKPAA